MVRSVTAALALIIFPGLMAGQEIVLEAPARATLEEVVHFDFDQSTITPEADQLLREKLPILLNSPTIRLRLEGHADERGSIEYNLALGARRAESVRAFLAGLGISTDRLSTTSFGEERPLVNESNPNAWAQNRRVEFVIDGETVIVEGPDVEDPEIVEPETAVVGDVTVEDPTVEPAPPPPTRVNSERERRSRFYRTPAAPGTVGSRLAPDLLWVARKSTWSAEWIGAPTVEEVEFDGQIESIVEEGRVRTAFPFMVVRLNLEPDFQVRLGDNLQIFRPVRVNPEWGVVLRPMGVLSVSRVAPNVVEGVVDQVYGLVRPGDLVRPAPLFDLRPGDVPTTSVANRTTATVIDFGELHLLYGLKAVTILDQGSQDGVAIGDEYVAFSGDGSTEDVIGRLRIVLTEEETSSAEIVNLEGPVFELGTVAYLDRKMQ